MAWWENYPLFRYRTTWIEMNLNFVANAAWQDMAPLKKMPSWMKTMRYRDNKAILVTGGAGYVGSILVRKLLQYGYRVICVDKLIYGGKSLVDVWGYANFPFHKIHITN